MDAYVPSSRTQNAWAKEVMLSLSLSLTLSPSLSLSLSPPTLPPPPLSPSLSPALPLSVSLPLSEPHSLFSRSSDADTTGKEGKPNLCLKGDNKTKPILPIHY